MENGVQQEFMGSRPRLIIISRKITGKHLQSSYYKAVGEKNSRRVKKEEESKNYKAVHLSQ